jgi:TRAP-type C4-dicarboxylate transport system substrate-binding protein
MKRSSLVLAAVVMALSLLAIPYADAAKAIKLHNLNTYDPFDGPLGAKLAQDIEKKTDLKVLGFGDSGGFFHFTNSKRPIKTPEDMKGLKIRTMGLDTHKAIVSALGGQPSVIPWAEVYTALQTGVADGQMNPVPIISFAKMNEVQKYLTLSGHLFAPYVWVMNKGFYDSLTPAGEGGSERRREVGHHRRSRCFPRHRGLGQGYGGAQQRDAGKRPHGGAAGQVPRPHHAGGEKDHR